MSIFFLPFMGAPEHTRTVTSTILDGTSSNERVGLLNFSRDWQYIQSTYLSLPFKQQLNSWIGYAIWYVAEPALFDCNTLGAKTSPFVHPEKPGYHRLRVAHRHHHHLLFRWTGVLRQDVLDLVLHRRGRHLPALPPPPTAANIQQLQLPNRRRTRRRLADSHFYPLFHGTWGERDVTPASQLVGKYIRYQS